MENPIIRGESKMRALIISEGYSRAGLAAARALGRAGWTVGAAAPFRRSLPGASRWVSRNHIVPLPEDDLDGFVEATARAVREGGYEVVFGAGDAEVLALSSRRDDVGAAVPHPEHPCVLKAVDKLELALAAERAGLGSPATLAPDERTFGSARYPIVVKAKLHWVPGTDSAPSRLAPVICGGPEEAAARAEQIREAGGEPLLQEVLAGELLSYAALVDGEGRIVADEQQVSDRVWPPPVGGGARAVTVPVDPDVASGVAAMLSDLRWFGLAQVQFLIQDGTPKLIDLNPRIYGSLALAVAAGANFPDLWGRIATGRPVPSRATARPGVRFQWLEGDLRRARVERRGGLGRDVASCLRFAPSATHSIWSADDPRPAFRHAGRLVSLGARKVLSPSRGP